MGRNDFSDSHHNAFCGSCGFKQTISSREEYSIAILSVTRIDLAIARPEIRKSGHRGCGEVSLPPDRFDDTHDLQRVDCCPGASGVTLGPRKLLIVYFWALRPAAVVGSRQHLKEANATADGRDQSEGFGGYRDVPNWCRNELDAMYLLASVPRKSKYQFCSSDATETAWLLQNTTQNLSGHYLILNTNPWFGVDTCGQLSCLRTA